MRKSIQIVLFSIFILGTIGIIGLLLLFNQLTIALIKINLIYWLLFVILWIAMINEGIVWVKNGKRSEWSDLVVIAFLFITVYLFTKQDMLTSLIGAFSIYLLFGIAELKDYEVLNKILLITAITYLVIFIAGIIGTFLNMTVIRDTAFSMSFWLILILGFAFFGRKYIVVWRFMSPQYLTLALYIIAWIGVASISTLFKINFSFWIYEVLIVADLFVYVITGPILDLMLGLKPTDDPKLKAIVEEVAQKLGMDPKKVKVRFGKYPIINAMAYGAYWDMRMGIIAPDLQHIPEEELKGIVCHEMAHSKGKHTLALTLISIGVLIASQIFKWPATYYDYTFNTSLEQTFPLFDYILLNIAIYFVLYIFVRMLEAQADLNTRRVGLGVALAKGLYNLESFYAYGREIGLNTMLLCDEKITEENRRQDYLETAEYLDKMIIAPSRGTLLSNFLNSHPPSYHRIIAMLTEKEIPIGREAIMPLSFLRKKTARQFFLETQDARKRFHEIATIKVKEEFHIEEISNLMEQINRREKYQEDIGQTYVFLNVETFERISGRLRGVAFTENVCEPVQFHITYFNPNTGDESEEIMTINPSINLKVEFDLLHTYILPKIGTRRLKEIDLEKLDPKQSSKKISSGLSDLEQEKMKGQFLFEVIPESDLKTNTKVGNKPEKPPEKSLFKYKLPVSVETLQEFAKKQVLFKSKVNYNVKALESVELNDSKGLDFIFADNSTPVKSQDVIVYYGSITLPIHNETQTQESEKLLLEFLQKEQFIVRFFLKKAVNNEFEGKVQQIIVDDNQKVQKVVFHTDFDQTEELAIKKIDFFLIENNMLVFESKSEISVFSKFITKIRAKSHPDQIVY